ncbi:MAG: WecB/TagA/CpsF family glycosyltransferase [Actinomycetota bacterium]
MKNASFRVLGVRVDAVQIPDVVEVMSQWIAEPGGCRSIAATAMHGLLEAKRDPQFRRALDSTDMVVADGTPLVLIGRRRGHDLPRRVYGPELMATFCRETGPAYSHYLYGAGPGVAGRLGEVLHNRHGCRIAGFSTPPFGEPSESELDQAVEHINACSPDVLWVGLSSPKQERFISSVKESLGCPVAVSVGAAFDFIAGTKSSAPRWMQEHGMEWFYRLSREPRRLWRRYLIGGPQFLWYVATDRGPLIDPPANSPLR